MIDCHELFFERSQINAIISIARLVNGVLYTETPATELTVGVCS